MPQIFNQLIDQIRDNHCLPLVSLTFLTNFMKYDLSYNYNFSLTSLLAINYSLLNVLMIKINNQLICLSITSVLFAIVCNYLLILDLYYLFTFLAFISNFCYLLIVNQMQRHFKLSFSSGELFIVSHLCVSYLTTSSGCLVSCLVKSSKSQLFCSKDTSNLVLQIIFIGIALIFLTEMTVNNKRRFRGKSLDLMIIFGIILSTYLLLYFCIKSEPIVWLKEFTFYDKNRTHLLLIWTLMIALMMTFTLYHSKNVKSKATTITRKLFHIIISIIYLIGIKIDIKFLSFSSAAVLAIFVLIEVLRIGRIPPFGGLINSVFEAFKDDKDRGLLTLTHIYLLVGCSLPIWMSPSLSDESSLLIASGVITVGFGDTAASIVGTLFGRHRWKGSNKTYEGTVSAIITQTIVSLTISQYFSHNILNCNLFSKLLLISFITSSIEANVREIDNLILPLYHYILIQAFL